MELCKEAKTDDRQTIPLYVHAYNQLNALIKTMQPGDKLPTEEELSRRFSISRNTLRQALQILQEDRVVYKRRGSGTYVSGAPFLGGNRLNNYCTAEESLRRQGISFLMGGLKITLEDADDIAGNALQLPSRSPLYVFTRTLFDARDGNLAYAHLLDFVPVQLVNACGPELVREELVREVESLGAMAQSGVTAVLAGDVYAKTLLVRKDTPLLLLQQVVYDQSGRTLYFNKTYYNTQATDFAVQVERK